MPWIRRISCLTVLLLLGCGSESERPKEPPLGQVFPTLPLPPNPEVVSRSGGQDALQITMRTTSDVGQVAEYYRGILSQGNWRLVSDVKTPDGATVLYAEQNGPPLWVRIWKQADRPGAMVQLTGAVTSKKTKPKTDSSTTRRSTHS